MYSKNERAEDEILKFQKGLFLISYQSKEKNNDLVVIDNNKYWKNQRHNVNKLFTQS